MSVTKKLSIAIVVLLMFNVMFGAYWLTTMRDPEVSDFIAWTTTVVLLGVNMVVSCKVWNLLGSKR